MEGELRARLGTMVADNRAAGADSRAAEAAAIAELGDPDRMAAELSGRPSYLIGPARFFEYRRILIIVLAAATPSVFGALFLVQIAAGAEVWASLLSALGVAFSVAVQVAFWLTVAFAIIERIPSRRNPSPNTWDPDDLPEVPASRVTLGETVVALLAYLLFIGLVLWQQNIWVVQSAGGEATPLLDPALWSFWLPWFLLVAVLEIAFALALYASGRWTWTLAGVNIALAAAFAAPAVMLILTDQVVSTQFRENFAGFMPALDLFLRIAPFLIVGIALMDVVDGFRKAYRAASTRAAR